MKKYLLGLLAFVLLISGCSTYNLRTLDVTTINDLTTLQTVIDQVSQEIQAGNLAVEEAEMLVDQLQQKYVELADVDDQNVEAGFVALQDVFASKSLVSYRLPLWAKKLGMTYPKGMILDISLSKITPTSATLVYSGSYDIAMQQAKIIAEKADLFVSKSFQQAQALAKIGNIEYVSGLDISSLDSGIVYVNHELFDAVPEYSLSVLVDQYGTLTIETTKYN